MSHLPPGPLCFSCFSSEGFEPVENPSDFARSWDALLGRSDDELKKFCEGLAKEAFAAGAEDGGSAP